MIRYLLNPVMIHKVKKFLYGCISGYMLNYINMKTKHYGHVYTLTDYRSCLW